MNDNNHESETYMELPKLQNNSAENSAVKETTEKSGSQSSEQSSPSPVQNNHSQVNSHTDINDSSTPQKPVATNSITPLIADDNDLIEKEWVLKAKAIVASTKDDPYMQNKEMGQYKADYIKKRFNKDIRAA